MTLLANCFRVCLKKIMIRVYIVCVLLEKQMYD